jgi:hypothetical protein
MAGRSTITYWSPAVIRIEEHLMRIAVVGAEEGDVGAGLGQRHAIATPDAA